MVLWYYGLMVLLVLLWTPGSPTSASQVLGLYACATMPPSWNLLEQKLWLPFSPLAHGCSGCHLQGTSLNLCIHLCAGTEGLIYYYQQDY